MAVLRLFATQDGARPGIVKIVFAAALFMIFFCAGLFMLFVAGAGLLDPDQTIRDKGAGILFLAVMGLAFCGVPLLFAAVLLKRQREAPLAEQAAGTATGPEAVRPSRPASNIPNALRGQTPPRDAVIVAEAPWTRRAALLFFAVMCVGFVYVGWNIDAIFRGQLPGWAGYVLMAVGALFFALGPARPKHWRSRYVDFIATHDGIYLQRVDGSDGDMNPVSTPETPWLFVPWANVTDIREIISNRGGQQRQTQSIEFTFRVTPDQARDWFPALDAQPSNDDQYRVVQLPILGWADLVPQLQQISGLK